MRRSQLRASKAMQDRTLAHPRITVHFNTEVDDVYGAEVLHGLKLRDANTGGGLCRRRASGVEGGSSYAGEKGSDWREMLGVGHPRWGTITY